MQKKAKAVIRRLRDVMFSRGLGGKPGLPPLIKRTSTSDYGGAEKDPYQRGVDRKQHKYFMLHIGKTGGTYTRHIISSIPAAEGMIRFLPHGFNLETALNNFPHEHAIFAIRNPLAIFVSGFNSRLRQGRPRYNNPWSANETIAFSAFQTPNELAEALGSEKPELRERAEFSMQSIQHVSRGLKWYLQSTALVRQCRSRISFILQQESLDEDIRRLLAKNGISSPHAPIHDDVIRHSSPAELDTSLSPTAVHNLTEWYRTDLDLYEVCKDLQAETNRR
jgi:tRNA-dihydrouridine synthase